MLGSERWIGLMRSLARLDGIRPELVDKIASMWGQMREMLLKGACAKPTTAQETTSSMPYVLLVVPPVSLLLPHSLIE